MATTQRTNRLNVDLQEYKQLWLDYCKAHSITPSAAFRQIVAKLTGGDVAADARVDEGTRSKKVRVELRLTRSEVAAVGAIARREGYSPTRWIVALINARLHATPYLGQQELEALARSNLQMLAIGRNLNQLARAANAGVSITRSGGPDVIEALGVAVKRHAEAVALVMAANVRRWRAQ
jgi:hypothetical protein